MHRDEFRICSECFRILKMLSTIKDATDRLRFLNLHRRHMRTRLELKKSVSLNVTDVLICSWFLKDLNIISLITVIGFRYHEWDQNKKCSGKILSITRSYYRKEIAAVRPTPWSYQLSAHNKGTHRCKHCPNFASFELFWNTGLLAQQTSWTVLDIQLVHHILQSIKVPNIYKSIMMLCTQVNMMYVLLLWVYIHTGQAFQRS